MAYKLPIFAAVFVIGSVGTGAIDQPPTMHKPSAAVAARPPDARFTAAAGAAEGVAAPGGASPHTFADATPYQRSERPAPPLFRIAEASGEQGRGGRRPPSDQWAHSGNRLIHEAAEAIHHAPSVIAKMRHQADLFGHQLVGSGNYLQLGAGDDQLLRLELKMPIGEQLCSVQQVCDGRFLWIRQELPSGASLGRVDLRRVREAFDRRGALPAVTTSPDASWLALGGLAQLLRGLGERFEFAAPQQAQVSGVPVFVVRGVWREARLGAFKPVDAAGQGESLALPPHLPHQVVVTLGEEDLFPYRVDYLRRSARSSRDAANSREAAWEPVATLELFEVRIGAAIDPLAFVYKPDQQEVTDHTPLVLRRLERR